MTKEAKNVNEADATGSVRVDARVGRWSNHFYVIGWTDTVQLSAKLNTAESVAKLRSRMAPMNLTEVGPFSYWLMKHHMPKLAMLPFWR